MLAIGEKFGEVKCEENTASCILNGENSRRGMRVAGTGTSTLLLRALSFQDCEAFDGGGVDISVGAIVDIELCVFSNCRATSESGGGGALHVTHLVTTVNIYGTNFNGNQAFRGDDIRTANGATIIIHNTCPSPYTSNTPIQGKMRMRMVYSENHS
jgi:hypothetical protein